MNFGKTPDRSFRAALGSLKRYGRDSQRFSEKLELTLSRGDGNIRKGVPRSRVGHEVMLATFRATEGDLEEAPERVRERFEQVLEALGARGLPLVHRWSGARPLDDQLFDVIGALAGRRLRPDASAYVEPVSKRLSAMEEELLTASVRDLPGGKRKAHRAWRDELEFTLAEAAHWLGGPDRPERYDPGAVWPDVCERLRAVLLRYTRGHSPEECRHGLSDPDAERMWWVGKLDGGFALRAGQPPLAARLLRTARDFRAEGIESAIDVSLRLAAVDSAVSVVADDVHRDRSSSEALAFLQELLAYSLEVGASHVPEILEATWDDLEADLGRKLHVRKALRSRGPRSGRPAASRRGRSRRRIGS